MTGDIAVSLANVTKKYRLFASPTERLKESLHPFRRRYHKEFWALKGISLDIPKGEVLGILGRNGSGKSTLLQIVASVLRPTSGTVAVNGRISALLELGAGFNPEFTGRQNVLLNGALMGVSHDEMLNRMPEIIAFADIGEFFDQPMKIYSSGMFVRVAFAAAVHVNPDILIIDEALAVGDAKFQHKCFERFMEFQKQGKTIILVSHSVHMVSNHCSKVLLLENGKLVSNGDPREVVDQYIELLFGTGSSSFAAELPETDPTPQTTASLGHSTLDDFISNGSITDNCPCRRGYNPGETRIGDRSAEIIDYVLECDGQANNEVLRGGAVSRLLIKVRFHSVVEQPIVGFAMKTVDGIEAYGTNTFLLGLKVEKAAPGDIRSFEFQFPALLNSGDYFIDLGIAAVDGTPGGTVFDVRRSVLHVIVVRERTSFTGLVDFLPTFSTHSVGSKSAGP